jgi:cell division protein FtsL
MKKMIYRYQRHLSVYGKIYELNNDLKNEKNNENDQIKQIIKRLGEKEKNKTNRK